MADGVGRLCQGPPGHASSLGAYHHTEAHVVPEAHVDTEARVDPGAHADPVDVGLVASASTASCLVRGDCEGHQKDSAPSCCGSCCLHYCLRCYRHCFCWWGLEFSGAVLDQDQAATLLMCVLSEIKQNNNQFIMNIYTTATPSLTVHISVTIFMVTPNLNNLNFHI